MPLPFKEAYDRRFRYFDGRFAAAAGACSSEAVHDTRVGLKRLRTFFDLVGSIDPGFAAAAAFAPAGKLFRAAGKVRNLHVLEAKVREASQASSLELSEYYNWLKEDERRQAKKFDRACRRFSGDFFASAWKTMAPVLEGPADRRAAHGAGDRFVSLIREIRLERSKRRDVRRLHFLRARTKEARYTLEILQECGLARDEAAVLGDRLQDVHQSLGRWHDEEILLGSLREFRKGREAGPLVSFKSYLEFSRLAKARKAGDLAAFGTAWAALLGFLSRGDGRRVLRPAAALNRPDGPPRNVEMSSPDERSVMSSRPNAAAPPAVPAHDPGRGPDRS